MGDVADDVGRASGNYHVDCLVGARFLEKMKICWGELILFLHILLPVYDMDIDIVKYLLNCGADVNGSTNQNNGVKVMAIDNCASRKSPERDAPVAQFLMEQGAFLENKDNQGFTPFLRSIDRNNIEMVRIFAAGGADLGAKDKKGRDGLQIAIDNKDLQLYKDDSLQCHCFGSSERWITKK